MEIKKDMVGKKFPPFTYRVVEEKILELVEAIGDPNPIYRDKETAQKEGYKDLVAPPTFITLATHWTGVLYRYLGEIGVDLARILHGEEEYEYFREIYPGDILTGEARLVSIEEKRGNFGPMTFVKIEIDYTNQEGEKVLRATGVIIVKN